MALPLDAINAESARRKRKAPAGYPTTLHKWWAQRPVAAARAVLFAQLVNDPCWKWELEHPGKVSSIAPQSELGCESQATLRNHRRVGQVGEHEQSGVLGRAKPRSARSWRETCELNRRHPQAGRSSIPTCCQQSTIRSQARLRFRWKRSVLAWRLTQATSIRWRYHQQGHDRIRRSLQGCPQLIPIGQGQTREEKILRQWHGAHGLAEDVRYYGKWMRNEAEKRIGYLASAR